MRLVWLFLTWVLVEIGLFAAIGGRIGVLATWAWVLASGAAGVWLMRWQKRSLVTRVFVDLRDVGRAVTPVAHSALIMLAAVLLILPGFLSDGLGLLLLVPGVRNVLIAYLRARAGIATMDLRPETPRTSDVIEGTATEVAKPSGWTKD